MATAKSFNKEQNSNLAVQRALLNRSLEVTPWDLYSGQQKRVDVVSDHHEELSPPPKLHSANFIYYAKA